MIKHLRRSCLLLIALTSLAALAQQDTFTVGTATASPGQKATGYIKVPAGVDAARSIPVVIVRGSKPGPVLALVSGLHGIQRDFRRGHEVARSITLEELIPELDPAQISGTVIFLPMVDSQSFLQKVPYVNPVDGKSMNRFYPGKSDGTQTERASFLITREVVERCDYLIDYHGGNLDLDLRLYSYWPKTGNEKQDAVTRGMVLAFGFDLIIIAADRPKDANASRYLDNTAITRGKPAIAVEAGYAGNVGMQDIDDLISGTLNVMRYLKMLPGVATMVEDPVWISKVDTISSDQTGLFYSLVARGTQVKQGTKVGYVTDDFGATIYEALAPADGVVLYICYEHSMKKGDTIAHIGEIAKNP